MFVIEVMNSVEYNTHVPLIAITNHSQIMENKNKMPLKGLCNSINICENGNIKKIDSKTASGRTKVESYREPICFTKDYLPAYNERNYTENAVAYSYPQYTMVSAIPHAMVNINPKSASQHHVQDNWKTQDLYVNTSQNNSNEETYKTYVPKTSLSDDTRNKKKDAQKIYTPLDGGVIYNRFSGYNVYFHNESNHNPNNNNNNINKTRRYSNSTNKRRSTKRNVSQEIHKRIHGLMERFTSKRRLLQIESNPPNLLKRNSWDHLSQAIWDVYVTRAQTEDTYMQKLEVWKMVYFNIQSILVRYGLFMVGSTMSGLGTDKSDIDMCLLVKPLLNDARSDALSYLQNIQIVLQDCEFVESTELILAKVPILKFKDSRYGFEVDLNCNNAVGIRNTHLMHCYAQLDWRVRPLVIMVKLWAQTNHINNAKKMTISSYSLALMVIHYLQCGASPPVIPCLHGLYPEKFNPNSEIQNIDIQEELSVFYSDNADSLGELFLGFLRYFTYFDYDRHAISVREGAVLSKEECRYTRSQKNDVTQWKHLCIEEPFDLTNTARSVYDVDIFEHIKHVFRRSFKTLLDCKNLASIFPSQR